MDELTTRLNNIPGAYFAFVAGIISYAKKKPESLRRIMGYLNSREDLTTSDVVHFVMTQPDFHEDGLSLRESAEHDLLAATEQ